MSVVHLGAKGTGVTGIFGVLLCLEQPVQYLIEMAIAVSVAFVVSFLLYKDKKEEPKEKKEELPVSPYETVSEERIGSPVSGTVILTSDISDATFAQEILGTTVAVEPEQGVLTAPCDGRILSIYDTGHAVCMTTPSGAELLIHVGIDTVKLKGRGFQKCVSEGEVVHKGDVLLKMDLEVIRQEGYETTIMTVLTNACDYDVEKTVTDQVSCGENLMILRKK